MAARRVVDPKLISALTEATKTQQVSGGFSKTLDERFAVWSTPVDKEFIIYIPKGPTCNTVDGELVFDPAIAHVHNAQSGKSFTTFRCMKNINPTLGEQLGYKDGECPICNALSECYTKYNTQLKMRAAEMGLDPFNEANNDALRPIREALRGDMAIQKAVKKYIIPIVVISDTGLLPETVDEEAIHPYFFPMSESAFTKKLMKPLGDQLTPITNPAGLFYKLNYKYVPKEGQKPNARDAAREMTITPIFGNDATLSKFVDVAEKKAEGFTAVQANTSVTEIAYKYADDVEKELELLMASTRAFNASVAANGAVAPTNALPAANAGTSMNNALSAFGATAGALPDAQTPATAPAQVAPAQVAPTQAAPAQAAPAQAAPVAGFAGFGTAPTAGIDLNG